MLSVKREITKQDEPARETEARPGAAHPPRLRPHGRAPNAGKPVRGDAVRGSRRDRELEALRQQLAEAEDTLRAIRSGKVDALIVNSPKGEQVYTLRGAERPYRRLIEEMNEGAVTVNSDGTILYCNKQFAEMVNSP